MTRLAVVVIILGAVFLLLFASGVGYMVGVASFRADENQEEVRENAVEEKAKTSSGQSTSDPSSSPLR